ncbi:uncharacterized protein L203_102896 [Cryptococcus depauperatus CBS 7841]|uniref:Alpha/beta hydrolase fold-3 domain-containing protein n=1 Tax=Cryptococcus depauperatus CBS 7841 TaxID=1295531 RepID=A0A1E3IDJ5_9TREE|nr:esterase/lipase [Cryptococcus depauperatus CBS 7841]
MPDLLTPQVLATAGPLVLDTFFKHFLSSHSNGDKDKDKAREDLMYDEAFVLMKTFLEIAAKHPVAALQRFGQAHTLSPPWVAVHRVEVSEPSLSLAAKHLVEALGGEDMAYKVAGGTKWWQVRAGQGVEAEWIVMKKDWRQVTQGTEVKANQTEQMEDAEEHKDDNFRPEMDRLRCMLYIHGGAYYWGSINTHRYTIWRHARKMHGRCFAVNYRKAPQYPFPCAILDCLAAYIYLVNPPPGSPHSPVDPKTIVIAGDSAGGGLCLALLQILRDTPGLTLPAGAVLISPWSDLTHSFPSVLQNTATDIIPPYGFIHKPSSLWPPPPPILTKAVQSRLRAKVREVVARVHAEKDSDRNGAIKEKNTFSSDHVSSRQPLHEDCTGYSVHASKMKGMASPGPPSPSALQPISTAHLSGVNAHPPPQQPVPSSSFANPADLLKTLVPPSPTETRPTTLAQCDTPLKLTVKEDTVVLDTQIQLYATNAQLCHPWISPVLGYLGGLPPLYIMCGDDEVLRDEIIYLAHKAANPRQYPIRLDVEALLPSLNGIENRYGPTNVHLQVYDGVCHDLPLFSMSKPARGCFRAIASFVRYVTPSAPGSLYIGKTTSTEDSQTLETPNSREKNRATDDIVKLKSVFGNQFTSSPKILAYQEGHSQPLRQKIQSTALNISAISSTSDLPSLHDESNSETGNNEQLEAKGRQIQDEGILPPPRGKSLYEHFTPEASQILDATSVNDRTDKDDDTGPRFSFGEGGKKIGFMEFEKNWGRKQAEIPGIDDSRAKEGEAGWPGIYCGENPFTNHIIRERVSTVGVIRPLSPVSSLAALNMPSEEIGILKEGPVMRYINGKALWDKKYERAGGRVEKRRKKNLSKAKKSGHKAYNGIMRIVREKMKAEQAKNSQVHDVTHKQKREGKKDLETGSNDNREVSGSWSWTWAFQGDAPPPSAIVSRRDFEEARQLALIADRIDSSSPSLATPFHGLNVWVSLAGFFSNNGEKERMKDALEKVKERRGQERESEEDDTAKKVNKDDSLTNVKRGKNPQEKSKSWKSWKKLKE